MDSAPRTATAPQIRSLRFSEDGKFLAVAEPADFVHIYDTTSGYSSSQEIDLFGEIAGCAFSPDSQTFFVSISDVTYSSLLQFHRAVDLRPREFLIC
jgi:WD40 repeat protein